jgi:Polyketide cyclase / dehydrase and lipid transport
VDVPFPAVVREWGSTADERAGPLPCDRFLPEADDVVHRAVDVAAPPAVVFRRLCQMRVAPYSYDLLDNLGRRSPRELVPGLERLEVGQRFAHIFTLVDVEPDRSLTIRTAKRLFGDVVATYAVAPRPGGSRLLVRLRVRHRRDPLGLLWRVVLAPGDLVMMRKQLRTFASLAEGDVRQVSGRRG